MFLANDVIISQIQLPCDLTSRPVARQGIEVGGIASLRVGQKIFLEGQDIQKCIVAMVIWNFLEGVKNFSKREPPPWVWTW